MRIVALDDWAAVAVAARELRRAEGEALVLDGSAGIVDGDASALAQVARLEVFTVAALGGACNATALAVALACDHAVAGPSLRISVPDAATLLRLRVPAALVARAGDLHAHRLLLSAQPLDAGDLAAAGLVRAAEDPLAAARDSAERALADPHAGLLRRALRAATRSTLAQAAEYEAELRELL